MPDGAYIWILMMLLMLLVFVAALLLGRRFQAKASDEWRAGMSGSQPNNSKASSDLWLRNGDVIEVPEK